MARILIPTPLRQFAGKQDTVEVSGKTVGEALSALTTQFPDLRKNLYTDEGKLRSFVNVYLNDEDIRYMNKEASPLSDGDTISIVPSIAGGADLWRRPSFFVACDRVRKAGDTKRSPAPQTHAGGEEGANRV
jgi:adenylyltransferase/sulfurtransferase